MRVKLNIHISLCKVTQKEVMSSLLKSIFFFKDKEVFSRAKLPLLTSILFEKPLHKGKHYVKKRERKWEKLKLRTMNPLKKFRHLHQRELFSDFKETQCKGLCIPSIVCSALILQTYR